MIIDDVSIKIKAGNGGKGAVAFNKNMTQYGPVGGSGGDGGNIYAQGVSDLGALKQFKTKKKIISENGQDGRGQYIDGRTGYDTMIKVPIGTVIHNLNTNQDLDVTQINEKVLIAKGGHGGRGNFHFRSSTNTSPKEFEYGTPGQEFEIRLELKMIADIGLLGFPNAGKSSLINELTKANSKVANYPFTTLEPHLGVYYDLIIADIPGIIEGASSNKGLGFKFLKHIERTEILFHLIASDSKDIVKEYQIIRNELEKYSEKLATKKEYILLTKTDLIDEKEIKEKIKLLSKFNKNIIPLSIYDFDKIEKLKEILNQIIKEKTQE
jgi:GTP-binding protein